jgi:hypothetical protein
MYSLPTVYVVDLKPLDLVQTLNQHRAETIVSFDFPAPYWPTGPPIAA